VGSIAVTLKRDQAVTFAGLCKRAAIGIELDADGRAQEIQRRCLKAGLLLDGEETQLLLLPP
jgi:hypothetical protein